MSGGSEVYLHLHKRTAVIYSVAVTTLFVASLYVTPGADARRVHRNAPNEVRRRLLAVAQSSAASGASALAVALLYYFVRASSPALLAHMLGVWPLDADALAAAGAALVLGGVLFLGPLVQWLLDDERESLGALIRGVPSWSLLTWRTVLFAPLLEELVFRACICAALRLGAAISLRFAVFLSALFFSIAHAHHAVHHINIEQVGFDRTVTIVALQCFYTFIFGALAAHVFMGSGRLLGAIVLHCFCNMMGLPDFGGALTAEKNRPVIWAAYVLGLIGFFVLLGPLTSEWIVNDNIFREVKMKLE